MSTIYNSSSTFQDAAAFLSVAASLTQAVSNSTKLELYGLYKFLTVSPSPNVPKPSIFDFTGKAKWEAWRSAGETYKECPAEAEVRYLEIAHSLGWGEGLKLEPEDVAEDEDDIWDNDEVRKKPKSDNEAIGPVMSTMVTVDGDQECGNAVSQYAIAGHVQGLLSYLQEHPEVDINSPDENGYTALHLAADRGHIEIVRALLARGAKQDIRDEDEFTAKELAEIAGHTEIANLLSDTNSALSS